MATESWNSVANYLNNSDFLEASLKYDGKPQPRKILVNVKGKIFSINPVINTIRTNNFNS